MISGVAGHAGAGSRPVHQDFASCARRGGAARPALATAARRLAVVTFGACLLLLVAGCTLLRRDPTPGRTRLASPLVSIPFRLVANVPIIEVNTERRGTWHFLVDTGSSVSLVSREFAERFGAAAPAATLPQVNVLSASGQSTTLSAVTVRRITAGDARFERVPALIYDFTELSAHFGERIDGVLGFPIFRETLLTLDYPQSRILLAPVGGAGTLRPGSSIAFDTKTKTPLIPIGIDGQTLVALIDSGSDSGLHLNPVGLNLAFAHGPVSGGIIATLAGERPQQIGRLAGTLHLGNITLPRPITDLTDELSSVGGAILRNFVVTFDQMRGDVTFFRNSTTPVTMPPQRSTGLSFSKTPAYWRVVVVIPDSPAETEGIKAGDLVVRIDGEPVVDWHLERFEARIAAADVIDFTFLDGLMEITRPVRIFRLVP